MNIIRQLFEIIQKKRTPADIDYSISAAVAAYSTLTLLYYFIFSSYPEFSKPLVYAVITTASYFLALVVLLKINRKEGRLVQTVTALFGVFSLTLLATLFLAITQYLVIIAIPVLIYGIIVCVRVIKSSFSCPTYLGVVILISVYFFSSIMLSIVSPQSTTEMVTIVENLQKVIEEQQATAK